MFICVNPRPIFLRCSPISNTFAIIGGSEAYNLLMSDKLKGERIGQIETPFGESQAVFRIYGSKESFLFLSRHGEKGYTKTAPYVNYRANIYALKEHGVKQIVSWSGPGAISTKYNIGQYVVVDDLIDETKNRKYTFFENKGIGFIRQSPVFCPSLRQCVIDTLKSLKFDYAGHGTYVCTQGPRLETAAEIKKYISFGSDLVGMTLVPEVFLAKELEMCYASICYVTNYAEGIIYSEYRPGELFEGLSTDKERKAVKNSVNNFPVIIETLASTIKKHDLNCKCQLSMERYKKEGTIGDDWHEWVSK
ncbi:MAG: 5'-methylthioadenosine phosphorylase [Candidatus Scalindua rubra]|uniref:5'-methylthioadenosine phosphorylase n=1 Tax=Candidatus Scalindua rubra TaxID=1872076 RepID=A0A1E3XAX1_9BACT|nr:MAG: 5'-methylthioadenosine phosphorylase [Candidatus Scalindua rubra]